MNEQLQFDFGCIWVNPIEELIKAILILRSEGWHVMEYGG